MQQDNSRNMIIFVVITLLILLVYNQFVLAPQQKLQHDRAVALQQAQGQGAPNGGGPAAAPPPTTVPFEQALNASPRIFFDTPDVFGSISLKGARIDNLFLKNERVTPDKNSPPVELLKPNGAANGYFAEFGWAGPEGAAPLMSSDTLWTATTPGKLTPTHPITLNAVSPGGLTIVRTISVDSHSMFTVTDTVTNTSGAALKVRSFGAIQRNDLPPWESWNAFNVHLGAVGVLDGKLKMVNFKNWKKNGVPKVDSTGGWVGITDKYWLTAIVPAQNGRGTGSWTWDGKSGVDLYGAAYLGAEVPLASGASTTATTRLFAGAKHSEVLSAYEKNLGIPRFTDAIDWGQILFWLTKPIFMVLQFFFHLVGNFGVAILMLTVAVKLLFFPLANQAFASMTKMKLIQPKVEALKKKYASDQAKQQQEMMALYAAEKINPLAGCLPILVQIPVFFALLKVLYVTIDMRHAPFVGWIHDLSDRDPTTIWTLFGLIPWDPASVPVIGTFLDGPLHLGLVALLYGGTMWLQQSMSPATPDPTQQQIMKLMPLIFMFILARYPIGLMIYWTWSTTLTILQQYVMMHRHKVDNPIDEFIAKVRQRLAPG